jgi:hypothetical protein
MPDPTQLKIGDRIRFISLPDEWSDPQRSLHRDSLVFMKRMIKRRYSSRVFKIDHCGYPWIKAKLRERSTVVHHYWCISESTGWRKVVPTGKS